MLNLHNTNQIATLNTSLSKFIFIRLVTNPYFFNQGKNKLKKYQFQHLNNNQYLGIYIEGVEVIVIGQLCVR